MNPLKSIRRLLHWQWKVRHTFIADTMLTGVLLVAVLLFFVAGFVCLPGCQSPQPIPDCIPSPRLIEAVRFQTCMTGPWPNVWRWLSAGGEWPVRVAPLCLPGVLVLPAACRVFDVDADGDVDLADFARVQNE